MNPSSRDRLSVDLRGLKAAVIARANALGVTPSDFARSALTEALGQPARGDIDRPALVSGAGPRARVRLCLRMSREHAQAAVEGARRAGMSRGDYLGGLVRNVPVLSMGSGRADHIAALMTSTAELATLSRNIRGLMALTPPANVGQAEPYRAMLEALAARVRQHIDLASRALAELRPRQAPIGSSGTELR